MALAASVVTKEDRARFNAQALAIIARLKVGPATALDLMGIALNYRARISELRTQYVIECVRGETNHYVYCGPVQTGQLTLLK